MQDQIITRLLDILAADPQLYAGGTAFADGWKGANRVNASADGQTALPGYVNLYDGPYRQQGSDTRPAIYLGDERFAVEDRQEHPPAIGGSTTGVVEYNVLTVNLRLVVQPGTQKGAWKQINQLRNNVKQILNAHRRDDLGHWWWLRIRGQMDGGLAIERTWVRGVSKDAEGHCSLPVCISYQYVQGSNP